MRRFILFIAAVSLTACATHMPDTSIEELANARAAIAAAKKAGAEKCAPELQAQAVAALYAAAHEFSEGDYHPDENAYLASRAESKAKQALAEASKNCQPKPVVKEIIKLDGVHFPHDSAKILAEDMPLLDKAVETLKRRSDINVEVAGHTDSSGSATYNQTLSARRAASVKAYFEAHGIDASRLTSKGFGESQPVTTNATKEGRAKNRRVELRIYE
ncbi:MAG: OmpA family protein [Mariprofundus sp.]